MIDYKKQWNCIVQFCCCNLSPRGDGNVRIYKAFNLYIIVAIYPREGTETVFSSGSPSTQYMLVAIYPREGTETGTRMGEICTSVACCNLSPRGDGNVDCTSKFHTKAV